MTKLDYTPIKEDDIGPICPYCEEEFQEVGYFEQRGFVKMKVVRLFVCPHCRKVLGTGMVGG